MKVLLALSICTLITTSNAAAQSVAGSLTTDKGKPIVQATITILNASDSSWLRSVVSDEKGEYHIAVKEPGEYLLEASAEGLTTQIKPCTLIKDSITRIHFAMAAVATELGGVTVTARKPFIEAKPGMMVVNVEGSAASAGSNAFELLQRSPGVQVDPNGTITMRGKTGVEVYVDGRPSRLSGDQLAAYLRSMTAEEIAQLELITQASAKYDAAGTAGIINIRTRAVRKKGLNGNIGATGTRATYTSGNLSGKITYRRNKLTAYIGEYFNYVNNHNTLDVNRKYLKPGTSEPAGNVQTASDVRFMSRFHRITAGGEYAFNNNTTIGIRARLPIGAPDVDYNNLTTINDIDAGTTTYTSGSRSMRNNWHEKELGLLGRHRFKDEGELSFDGYIVGNQSADHGLFLNEERNAQGQLLSPPDAWDMTFPVRIRVLSGQVDYSRALDKKTKVETGVKYTGVSINNIADYRIPDATGAFVPDTLRSTQFLYDEKIIAAYGSLSRTVNAKLDIQAGLRAEQTVSEGTVTKTGEHFNRSYLSLFPTAFASYKTDSQNTLTFSYGRRLDRPGYYILNPARDYVDKYSYRVGNPKLKPQFVNNFELSYSFKGKLSATLSYMKADGIISDFFVQDDQTKTAYEVHDNIAGFRQGGLSLNYNNNLQSWWTVNLYGDFYLREYTGNYYGLAYTRQGAAYTINVNNQLTLGQHWGAEVSGWYNGPSMNTVFTQSHPMGSLDVGISKKLLSDSLVIKLAFSDVLGTQHYRGSNRFANFDTDVESTWDARRAVLSVNYSFGKNIDMMQRRGDAEARRM